MHARSSLLQLAAFPRGGLTPAEAPLIDAEILFRQPQPPKTQRPKLITILYPHSYEHRPIHETSLVSFEPSPKPVIADDVASTRYVKERDVEIVDVDRVVDQLLDRVFLPCRQVLAPLCDHGG